MPRGVKKTTVDKLYDIASTMSVDDFISVMAELMVMSIKDVDGLRLHQVFGEMGYRAQLIFHAIREQEEQEAAARKAAAKPKSLSQIVKRTARRVEKKSTRKPVVKHVARKVVGKRR